MQANLNVVAQRSEMVTSALPNMFHEFFFTQNHNSKGKNPQSVHKMSPVFGSSRTTWTPTQIYVFGSIFGPCGRRFFDSCLKIRRRKEGHAACKTEPVETHVWFRNGTVMLPSLSNLNLLHISDNRDVCDPFLPISWKSKFNPSHRSRLYLSQLNTEEELVCMFQS